MTALMGDADIWEAAVEAVPDLARFERGPQLRNGMTVDEALALTADADAARTQLARILSALPGRQEHR
jgi:hypothetical protein